MPIQIHNPAVSKAVSAFAEKYLPGVRFLPHVWIDGEDMVEGEHEADCGLVEGVDVETPIKSMAVRERIWGQ